MSQQQKSLILLNDQGDLDVLSTDIPEPGPGEILVKVYSTALNPVDWKIVAGVVRLSVPYPIRLGYDAAGTVAKLGDGVTSFVIGDRVLHEGSFELKNATHQQYAIVPAEIAAKIPPNISFDEAATVPVALVTAAVGLSSAKVLPVWEQGGRDKYTGQPILVLGGATSIGQYVIQLAKLSGFSPIIASASLRHVSYLQSLGATHVLDRNLTLDEYKDELGKITKEPIKLVYDTVALPETQLVGYELLAQNGKIILALPPSIPEDKMVADKETVDVYGNVHLPESREVGVSLWSKVTELLGSRQIKPLPLELLPNGLHGILGGLEKLKSGQVSARKLVARPQDTV